MQLKSGILRTQRAEQVFIPLDSEVGVQPALHQDARAAERNGFIDLRADFFEAANVGVGCARATVERAKGPDDLADVRLVDVAIDDVGDDVLRVTPRAYLIGSGSHACDVVRFEQGPALVDGHPLAREHAIQDWLNVRHGLTKVSRAKAQRRKEEANRI